MNVVVSGGIVALILLIGSIGIGLTMIARAEQQQVVEPAAAEDPVVTQSLSS